MIISDLDYIVNVDSAPIEGGFEIGVVLNTFIDQKAFAFSSAGSDNGDASAIAIANNESTINIGNFPLSS